MIPRIIHYCWFGGNPLPESAQKCISSWKEHCPDYKIIEWNENNFDINYNDYVREAYAAQKWAFVSDVARLYALVHYGGIYMDIDVEVLKPLDDLLSYNALSGFESETDIPTGLMASCEKQMLFIELLMEYDTAHFLLPDGSYDTTTNVTRIMKTCQKYGFVSNNKMQTVRGMTFFPSDFFCPKDHRTKTIHLTDNTYTIHHFDGSWFSPQEKYASELAAFIYRRIPFRGFATYSAQFVATAKYGGLSRAVKKVGKLLKRRPR